MSKAVRHSVASVPVPELRERLERAKAALGAVKRAPDSKAADALELDLRREINALQREIAQAR